MAGVRVFGLVILVFAFMIFAGCASQPEGLYGPGTSQTQPLPQPTASVESTQEQAQDFCGHANVAMVYVCGNYFGVVSSLLGGGTTYYKNGKAISCPVVGPDAMSADCKQLMLGSNCAQIDICNGTAVMPGSDRDAHGCIGSAGYTWCDSSQKCIRPWEENCTSAEAQPFSPEMEAKLDAAAQRGIDTIYNGTQIPGVIVGVWVPGEGSWTKAYGYSNLYGGVPMNINDKVRIGSNTKTYVATVILQLQDEGKLSLDDKLSKYDLGITIPNADNITLRELGSMTSGLYEYLQDQQLLEEYTANPMRNFTPKELVEAGLRHPANFAPGTNYSYSNTGYVLLGMIIEKVTGNRVDQEIRTRILVPNGLVNTTFPISYAGMPCPYTHGYTWIESAKVWEDATITQPSWAWAAGAMVSDIWDMKKWVKEYVTGTTNSAAAQKERLKFVQTGMPVYTFGFGIVNFAGWMGYTGGLPGYNTAAYYLPEKDATIVVFTMDGAGAGAANSILFRLINATTPEKLAPYMT